MEKKLQVFADLWIDSGNVAADYLNTFGKPARHVTGPRLWLNSQHTCSAAESYFADPFFCNTRQQ